MPGRGQPALPRRGNRKKLFADPAGHDFGILRRRRDFGGGRADRIKGGEEVAGFPNVGAGAVGADLAGIAPSVDGEELVRHGSGKVHGSAVDADDKCRLAQEPEEFSEAGAVEKVGDVGREAGDCEAGATDQDDRNIDRAAESEDGFR